MHAAVDTFLRNGTLPFVGRREEVEEILDLWRHAVDAGRMRAMSVTAEAGSGKSRLLDEVIDLVRTEGGSVIHAKLYPEAKVDLVRAIAGGIAGDPALERFGVDAEKSSIDDVAGVVRRISRLRRTLLVIEDIHLLPEEAHADLEQLLRGIADETLAMLVATRPVELGPRGILEPYLVRNRVMQGLVSEDVGRLWQQLFGIDIKGARLRLLAELTQGNPLALRSALRGLLEAEGLRKQGEGGGWRLVMPVPLFESTVHQSVSLVVEGLLAGLRPEVRAGAARLALLGEVIARESAVALLDDPAVIDELVAASLLVPTVHPVAPLAAWEGIIPDLRTTYPRSRTTLLAFTHSLLQNRLSEEMSVVPAELANVVSDGRPLYSLLPLTLLSTLPTADAWNPTVVASVAQRIGMVVQSLDRTGNWREVRRLWNQMASHIPRIVEKLDESDARLFHIWWVISNLSLLGRRELGSPAWLGFLEEADRISQPVDDDAIANTRLSVICHILEYESRTPDVHDVVERAEAMVAELLKAWPRQEMTSIYIFYLGTLAGVAARLGSIDVGALVYAKARQLLANPELPSPLGSLVRRRILHFGLEIFTTPAEMVDRFAVLDEIEEEMDEEDGYYGLRKISFLLEVGEAAQGAELASRVQQTCWERGLWFNHFLCLGAVEVGTAAIDYDRQGLLDRTAAARRTAVPDMRAYDIDRKIIGWLCAIGMLADDPELVPTFLAESSLGPDGLSPAEQGVLALVFDNLTTADARAAVGDLGDEGPPQFFDVERKRWEQWRTYLSGEVVPESADLLAHANVPVFRLSRVVRSLLGARIWMLLGLDESAEAAMKFRLEAQQICEESLDWLVAKGLLGFTPSVIRLLADLDAADQVSTWRERINGLLGDHEVAVEQEADASVKVSTARIAVTMIGTIGIAIPPEETASLRGSRLRTILGLLAAAPLLERPMTGAEFTSLAGGTESDPERARKKKNMGIVRLREVLGAEAILTDGEAPRLDPDRVTIDIVTAIEHLDAGAQAIRAGSIIRGLPLLRQALQALAGEVPFPTLYDDFFEAVRSDIDHRVRTVLLDVSGRLRDLGELPDAIDLLTRGARVLSGDDEIDELLAALLSANGDEVEAERVRMRSASG